MTPAGRPSITLGESVLRGARARPPSPPAQGAQDLSKYQFRSQGPGWGPDGSAGGAGAAFAPGYSVNEPRRDPRPALDVPGRARR